MMMHAGDGPRRKRVKPSLLRPAVPAPHTQEGAAATPDGAVSVWRPATRGQSGPAGQDAPPGTRFVPVHGARICGRSLLWGPPSARPSRAARSRPQGGDRRGRSGLVPAARPRPRHRSQGCTGGPGREPPAAAPAGRPAEQTPTRMIRTTDRCGRRLRNFAALHFVGSHTTPAPGVPDVEQARQQILGDNLRRGGAHRTSMLGYRLSPVPGVARGVDALSVLPRQTGGAPRPCLCADAAADGVRGLAPRPVGVHRPADPPRAPVRGWPGLGTHPK